jgi:hypothetical protein
MRLHVVSLLVRHHPQSPFLQQIHLLLGHPVVESADVVHVCPRQTSAHQQINYIFVVFLLQVSICLLSAPPWVLLCIATSWFLLTTANPLRCQCTY